MIQRIAPSGTIRSNGATEVDATGQFVVPGLFNIHDHLSGRDIRFTKPGQGIAALHHELAQTPDRDLVLLMAANAAQQLYDGTTTVRDVGSHNQTNIVIREAVRLGRIPGPRVLACGEGITSTGGHGWDISRQADGPEECRKAVREQLRAGADLIKIMASGGMSNYPRESASELQFSFEEILAIVQEAHNRNRRTCAHANPTKVIQACVRAGVDSIEHGIYIDEETVGLMKAARTAYVPTLSSGARLADRDYNQRAGTPAFSDVRLKNDIGPRRESIRMCIRAGIKVGVGADGAGDIIDEMEFFTELGYDTMQALCSGTRVSAEICGVDDMLGTVQAGKIADVLVLLADPLETIRNATKVRVVIKEGRVVRDGEYLMQSYASRHEGVAPPVIEHGWAPSWRPGWWTPDSRTETVEHKTPEAVGH
jgi:imidazolonepropionase-like amidohydrolase